MWRSVRIRWLSACAAAALLAVGLGGCHPGQTPASSDSSVVTDYPPVSTPTTESSGSATTTESTGPEDTGPGGSRLVTVTRRVSDTSGGSRHPRHAGRLQPGVHPAEGGLLPD